MAIPKRWPAGEEWREDARCQLYPADWWSEDATQEEQARAKRICARECPVRTQCLRAGLRKGEVYTIWGGIYLDPAKKYITCRVCGFGCATGKSRRICEYCKNWVECVGGCGRVLVRLPKVQKHLCLDCRTVVEAESAKSKNTHR